MIPRIILSLSLAGLVACRSGDNSPAPATLNARLSDGGRITSKGFAAEPIKISDGKSVLSIPLPKSSLVSIEQVDASSLPKISVTLSADSALELHTNSLTVSGPKSFPPPSPPSALDRARAATLKWFYWAGIALSIGALFLLWQAHGKAAAIAALGSVGVPLLGNFVSSDAALWVSIAVGCITTTLFVAWFMVRRNTELTETIKRRIHHSDDLAG